LRIGPVGRGRRLALRHSGRAEIEHLARHIADREQKIAQVSSDHDLGKAGFG
jgi:hypothetical protein